MLNWYDEPPELLRQAVAGAATIADRLVAADGAFELFPGGKAQSPDEQWGAIENETAEQGLGLTFLPSRLWPGQVSKRTATLRAAVKDSDWVMVVDADWKISGNRFEIRRELATMQAGGVEQVLVRFIQPANPDRPLEQSTANVWHLNEMGQLKLYPFIYRVLRGMAYEQWHWMLAGNREDGTRVGMFGGAQLYPQARTAMLGAEHLFEHRCMFRDTEQIERIGRFIRERDARTAAGAPER